jgi:hypothetical protein
MAYAFKTEEDVRRVIRSVLRSEMALLRPKKPKKWRGGAGGTTTKSNTQKWGVVISSQFAANGITALTGKATEDLTVGFGDVQIYNQDGTPRLNDQGQVVTEIWFNWMNTGIPPRTPVMGNLLPDGTTWVVVAPCGQLEEPEP